MSHDVTEGVKELGKVLVREGLPLHGTREGCIMLDTNVQRRLEQLKIMPNGPPEKHLRGGIRYQSTR